MILHTEAFDIHRIESALPEGPVPVRADYVICRADCLDVAATQALLRQGFQFLDRILYFEISTRLAERTSFQSAVPGVDYVCDAVYEEAVFQLAYRAFKTDRRFHLESAFHQEEANKVIKAYLLHCKAQGMKLYKARHNSQLLGFAIADERADENGRYFENVLGATLPGIRGKMVAAPLYTYMIASEKERFRRYVGRVSSANAASINLHFQLGGRVTKVYEEYIFRNRR